MKPLGWLFAFAGTCLFIALSSFFPECRFWGFGVWARMGSSGILVSVGTAGLVTIAAYAVYRWTTHLDRSIRTFAAIGVVLFATAYLFRPQTFYLGDGYTLLALLEEGNPLIEKMRQLGESMAHLWLWEAIDGETQQDGVLVYRIISYTAGVLFVAVAAWLSRKLYEDRGRAFLLFVGLVSSGYMLLYFGYVENYSIFGLSVLIYCLVGLLVWQGRVNHWLMVLLQAVTVLFHIFGVTFIPATLYIIYRRSALHQWVRNVPTWIQATGILATGILVIVAFVRVWSRDLFFQISLVPLVEGPLTQEGYTLFSGSHLIDYLNLLFILLPGILVLAGVIVRHRLWRLLAEPEYRWLGLAAAGALGAAFIFDPKLGMPRDWDLFAFAGIPLAVLLYRAVLSRLGRGKGVVTAVMLCVFLGFTVLFARVYSTHDPEIAIARFRDYLYLDKVKNRNAWILLTNYYERAGDSTTAEAAYAEWKGNFPEEELIAKANEMFYEEQDVPAAKALLDSILRINPTYPDAYAFLGMIYLQEQRFDSALATLKLADALSPNRPNNLNNIAHAYYGQGKMNEAEDYLLEAARLDSTGYASQYNLARFYQEQGKAQEYFHYLQEAGNHPEAPDQIKKELVVEYLRRQQFQDAVDIVNADSSLQQDSAFVSQVQSMLPRR